MAGSNSVLIIVELTKDKNITPISLECLAAGKAIAGQLGGSVQMLVMGSGISDKAEELRHFGAERIYVVDNPLLQYYQPECYISAFKQVYEKIAPKVILMGNTFAAIDFAPRMAFYLNVGLITDCVEIKFDSGNILFAKPVYSSNIIAEYSLAVAPYIATLRSGIADPISRSGEAAGEIGSLPVTINASAMKMTVVEREEKEEEGVKLENADVIVAGGRGMGGPEGFAQLSDLAKTLKGAVGASRPPCDLGWVSPNAQVGQTGAIVRPSLYIAVGISGSTQHFAGMSGSKTIVAINKDDKANIFKMADYGVVGQYQEILPAFKEALEKEIA